MVRMADILKKAREGGRLEEEVKMKPEAEPDLETKEKELPSESSSAEIAPAFKKTGKEEDIKPPAAEEKSEVKLSPMLKNEIKSAATSEEIGALYDETANLIKEVMEGSESAQKTSAKIKNIIISIEKFVNYQILNNDFVIEKVSRSGRGKELFNSPINVSVISIEIGVGLGFERAELIKLGTAAVMHDIEAIKFSTVYRQSRRLSVREYDKMIGASLSVAKILERFIDIYKATVTAAPEESSQIDKTGYLYGLNSEAVDEYAKVIRLAEIYELMVRPSAERNRLTPGEALKEIIGAKDVFENRILKVFMGRIGPYPVGSWVKLNSGEKARVVKRNPGFPLRPVVQVEHEVEGKKGKEIKILNLKDHTTVFIKRFLKEEEL